MLMRITETTGRRELMRKWIVLLAVLCIALMLQIASADEETEIRFESWSMATPQQCVCDQGHEWEALSCGLWFSDLGHRDWGPYCPIHLGEFLEDNFPKAWLVDND